MIDLYTASTPNGWKASVTLEELGMDYTVHPINLMENEQKKPEFLALNPNGLIPVLETPQGPVFETGAILLWLGDTHGGLGPLPQDAARADYLKWLFYTANTLHPALRMLFYPEKYIGADAGHQAALRAGLHGQIDAALALLDQLAATGPAWLGSDSPTGLDFYIAACLRWCALYPANAPRDWLYSSSGGGGSSLRIM